MIRDFNALDIVGLCLFPVPLGAFYLVLTSQYKHLMIDNILITIFMVRAALLIPVFGSTIIVALIVPRTFPAMRVIQSVFEAYGNPAIIRPKNILLSIFPLSSTLIFSHKGVWAFYAALVTNVGGPSTVATVLHDSNIPMICCRFKTDPAEKIYNRVKFAMWQFLWFRPLIQIIGAVASYVDNEPVYSAMVLTAAGSTIYMIPALITGVRVLYDECSGLKVALKFLVVKVSVGLLLIEDAVQSMLYATSTIQISDDLGLNNFSEEEKLVRIYW